MLIIRAICVRARLLSWKLNVKYSKFAAVIVNLPIRFKKININFESERRVATETADFSTGRLKKKKKNNDRLRLP